MGRWGDGEMGREDFEKCAFDRRIWYSILVYTHTTGFDIILPTLPRLQTSKNKIL